MNFALIYGRERTIVEVYIKQLSLAKSGVSISAMFYPYSLAYLFLAYITAFVYRWTLSDLARKINLYLLISVPNLV